MHMHEHATTWLTEEAAAAYTGYRRGTLRNYRYTGGGPVFVKTPGGAIRYLTADLDAWMLAGHRAAA